MSALSKGAAQRTGATTTNIPAPPSSAINMKTATRLEIAKHIGIDTR